MTTIGKIHSYHPLPTFEELVNDSLQQMDELQQDIVDEQQFNTFMQQHELAGR
jgi:hypothetical protein